MIDNERNRRKMPVIVKKLFNALKTTPLTSVESECAFSTSGNFVTKIRSSLNDDTIHALLFLKNIIENKKMLWKNLEMDKLCLSVVRVQFAATN